ncbi:MAG: hypothetical protein RIB98_15495 [Acidimicrobiales bacterium]
MILFALTTAIALVMGENPAGGPDAGRFDVVGEAPTTTTTAAAPPPRSEWTGSLSFPRGTFLTVTFVEVTATVSDAAGNTANSPTRVQLEVIPCL